MQEIKRLAIISTHPVQYYAPLFKLLHERSEISIKVYYTWGEQSLKKHDPGFDRDVEWDLPLLEGYPYEWAVNVSSDPGTHHFGGIKTPGLIKQVLSFNPDALLVFGWAYQSHLALIRHFSGKTPIYFRGDSTLLDQTGFLKRLLKKIWLSWVYSYIDHAFYTGLRNKEYFMYFGLTEDQLSFAPHAVDNARFAENREKEANQIRDKFNLNDKDILILFAGKLESKKDPQILLKAFVELRKPRVHLLFVGNGSLEKELKSLVHTSTSLHTSTPLHTSAPLSGTAENQTESFQITNQVHFMDFQNQTQMPVIYQACDLFCLPSKGPGETWGLAVNEAMACGKAVLASDKAGSGIDLVIAGKNGGAFTAGDTVDLKDKLDQLSNARNTLVECGKHSAEIIKDWNFISIAFAIENHLKNEPQR